MKSSFSQIEAGLDSRLFVLPEGSSSVDQHFLHGLQLGYRKHDLILLPSLGLFNALRGTGKSALSTVMTNDINFFVP